MRAHRIQYSSVSQTHQHIDAVATNVDGEDARTAGASRYWPVAEVRQALARGDVFYTAAERRTAFVHPHTCLCGYQTITSDDDVPPDIELSRLPPAPQMKRSAALSWSTPFRSWRPARTGRA